MKTCFLLLGLVLAFVSRAFAATSINASNQFAYGANLGWLNAAADRTNGAVIGEYACSGYIWSANIGWIHLGDGTPVNGVRYQNNTATDFGINHDGVGNLRGLAYSANAGWIHFESNGAPRIDLKTGWFTGAVWSANCGWISLGSDTAVVQTDTLQAGADTDGDGITDAWELSFTNTLAAFSATADTDRDGVSDLGEYLADTSPLNVNDQLRIVAYRVAFGVGNETNTITWTTRPTRCYRVDTRANLNVATPWRPATPILAPDSAATMTRALTFAPSNPERYLRVNATRPLTP